MCSLFRILFSICILVNCCRQIAIGELAPESSDDGAASSDNPPGQDEETATKCVSVYECEPIMALIQNRENLPLHAKVSLNSVGV